MRHDQELIISIIVFGGIILAGLLVILALSLLAIAVYNRTKKRKVIKELYDEKERENGQEKGGAQGHW